MRTAAQIDEFPLAVEAQRGMIGEARLQMFNLQFLFQIGDEPDGLVTRKDTFVDAAQLQAAMGTVAP